MSNFYNLISHPAELLRHPLEATGLGIIALLIYVLIFYYLFVFAMAIYRAYLNKVLKKWQYVVFAPPLLILVFMDYFFNYTIAVIGFWQWPPKGDYTLSDRMQTYHNAEPNTKRGKFSAFVCDDFLNLFDPTGKHC